MIALIRSLKFEPTRPRFTLQSPMHIRNQTPRSADATLVLTFAVILMVSTLVPEGYIPPGIQDPGE